MIRSFLTLVVFCLTIETGRAQENRQLLLQEKAEAFEKQREKLLKERQQEAQKTPEKVGFAFHARGQDFEILQDLLVLPQEAPDVQVKAVQRLKSGFILYRKQDLGLMDEAVRVHKKSALQFFPAAREKRSEQIFYVNGRLRIKGASEAAVKNFAAQQGLEIKRLPTKLDIAVLDSQDGTDLRVLLQKAESFFGAGKVEWDIKGVPAVNR